MKAYSPLSGVKMPVVVRGTKIISIIIMPEAGKNCGGLMALVAVRSFLFGTLLGSTMEIQCGIIIVHTHVYTNHSSAVSAQSDLTSARDVRLLILSQPQVPLVSLPVHVAHS